MGIEPTPDWLKTDLALKDLSWLDQNAIRDSHFVFSLRYEADALGSPDPEWSGQRPRSIQSTVDEKLALASLALWLVRPSRVVGHQLLHFRRDGDPESRARFSVLNQILVADYQVDDVPTAPDLQLAKTVLNSILTLARKGNLWTSIRILLKASLENEWEIRYLLFWIFLEALFGPSDGREITYRISQRISLFLGRNADECRSIFEKAKEGYGWRSKVVHGMRLTSLTEAQSKELTKFQDEIVRQIALKVLSDTQIAEKFNGKQREEYLDKLLYDRVR